MSLQLELNQKTAAAERYKLQPFSDDLFSVNSLGRFAVFLHAESVDQGLLTMYCPLLKFGPAELDRAVMLRLLQLNQPSDPAHQYRVGVDVNSQLWLTVVMPVSEFLKPECQVDRLLDVFITQANEVLAALDDVQAEPAPAAEDLITPSQMLWG
ncbi:MAG: hypothetical protein IAB19_02250 [Proteobacteria bacterium]|uniref:Tir chaperone family protein n=1 Tax=Candidatus Avisuccinivibrio stercorigallinarum TaxID=2840704 RepID=A0A9D9DB90_9GAMM|nr:hypothetical protein [Candidatus Avisuccinivibrio stercorigallinarum]